MKEKEKGVKAGIVRWIQDLMKSQPEVKCDPINLKKTLKMVASYPQVQLDLLETKFGFTLSNETIAQVMVGLKTYRKPAKVELTAEAKFLIQHEAAKNGIMVEDWPSLVNDMLKTAVNVIKWDQLNGVSKVKDIDPEKMDEALAEQINEGSSSSLDSSAIEELEEVEDEDDDDDEDDEDDEDEVTVGNQAP